MFESSQNRQKWFQNHFRIVSYQFHAKGNPGRMGFPNAAGRCLIHTPVHSDFWIVLTVGDKSEADQFDTLLEALNFVREIVGLAQRPAKRSRSPS
jgi:hypothetical protein